MALPWLLLYGLAVGLSLGLTGGGGSIITVPLLVYAVGEPVHVAIGTSLVVVGGVALFGFLTRLRRSNPVDGLLLGGIGLFGAVPGRLAAQYFSGRTLLLLFAIIMVIASVAMYRSKTYEASADRSRSWPLVAVCGVALGFLTGFLGVGGGFLIVPALVLLLGMSMPVAIPTSLLVIAINCAAALAGSALIAHRTHVAADIDWRVALIFLLGGIVGAIVGGAIAGRLSARTLKHVFAVFIFCLGLFVIASVVGIIPLTIR